MSKAALDKVTGKFKAQVVETHAHRGDETVVVKPDKLKEICTFLRDDPALAFNMLTDATAVDYLLYPKRTAPRFEVVYHFYSTTKKHRLRLKVQLEDKDPQVDSLCELWAIADWMEREIWDMYGIKFKGHPDLRRILLYEEFDGHPLRKDYPKERRKPLSRRPDNEIAEVLAKRGGARSLIREEV